MKAKLKKDINGEYFLEGFIRDIPRQINVYQQISETKARFGFGEHTGKLSKQNCDEIFGIVNVEELAQEVCDDTISSPYHCYIAGFNKNAELNKDKVFTKQDMFDLYAHIVKNGIISGVEANEYIQFLQQPTEIEVEIEMEVVPDFYSRSDEDGSIFTSNKKEQSKLDSEGCLVLTKKI